MRNTTDKRIQFLHHRIEREGTVWFIDGKYDPVTQKLKVYRVHGDVTQPQLLNEALEIFTNVVGLRHSEAS